MKELTPDQLVTYVRNNADGALVVTNVGSGEEDDIEHVCCNPTEDMQELMAEEVGPEEQTGDTPATPAGGEVN